MNRTQLIRLCDALVLALLVGIFASLSWIAGLTVAVIGFWLGFLLKPRRYPRASAHAKDPAKRSEESHHSWVWDPLDPINRHWHW